MQRRWSQVVRAVDTLRPTPPTVSSSVMQVQLPMAVGMTEVLAIGMMAAMVVCVPVMVVMTAPYDHDHVDDDGDDRRRCWRSRR
jgi:hypothetical protein